jgi:hypothetical protein
MPSPRPTRCPACFAPQCDISATLVLSQSGAQAGIAWYNVPTSPTAAPSAVYTIVPLGHAARASDHERRHSLGRKLPKRAHRLRADEGRHARLLFGIHAQRVLHEQLGAGLLELSRARLALALQNVAA